MTLVCRLASLNIRGSFFFDFYVADYRRYRETIFPPNETVDRALIGDSAGERKNEAATAHRDTLYYTVANARALH